VQVQGACEREVGGGGLNRVPSVRGKIAGDTLNQWKSLYYNIRTNSQYISGLEKKFENNLKNSSSLFDNIR
jgi:hypothetical protein